VTGNGSYTGATADSAAQTVLNCCASFPRIPPPLVERPQLLYILDTLFSAPADVVMIDGEAGAAKTELAAQFASGRPNEAQFVGDQQLEDGKHFLEARQATLIRGSNQFVGR
jgi:hypothetical protein